MAHHQLRVSFVPPDQTSPSLSFLQAKESIISQCRDDNTAKQGSTSPKRNRDHEDEIKSAQSRNEEITILGLASAQVVAAAEEASKGCDEVFAVAEDSGRERLKKHRLEVAGRVWIPDVWGQEEFLKDWVDCTAFDDSLFPNGILSARSALVEEGRRGTSSRIRIENRC
ncbi:protein BIC1 [Argentina anserina]|uniref:protein BIC1 n=1 Tax=Argentina anserina TaxID=57926 RepID=UPI002176500D|nr:protein BIC1 [Potentilla anserina]